MRYISPLRYPGGKAPLAGFLEDLLDLNGLRCDEYFEPYAGGAGAALELLQRNAVKKIHINDADIRIYAFWEAVCTAAERFVDDIFGVPLNMDEWFRQREICRNPNAFGLYDIGFSTFYMNRCNRSGILLRSGPIGGLKQNGKWKLDVRFNRAALAERVLKISASKDRINIYHTDAVRFLKKHLPKGKARERVFVYLDPPYVQQAERLYMNVYTTKDHESISKYLLRQRQLHWLLSYDDVDLIRRLYSKLDIFHLPVRYSLQAKRTARELLVASNGMIIPVAADTATGNPGSAGYLQ
jgi:DNA adenine methylase